MFGLPGVDVVVVRVVPVDHLIGSRHVRKRSVLSVESPSFVSFQRQRPAAHLQHLLAHVVLSTTFGDYDRIAVREHYGNFSTVHLDCKDRLKELNTKKQWFARVAPTTTQKWRKVALTQTTKNPKNFAKIAWICCVKKKKKDSKQLKLFDLCSRTTIVLPRVGTDDESVVCKCSAYTIPQPPFNIKWRPVRDGRADDCASAHKPSAAETGGERSAAEDQRAEAGGVTTTAERLLTVATTCASVETTTYRCTSCFSIDDGQPVRLRF